MVRCFEVSYLFRKAERYDVRGKKHLASAPAWSSTQQEWRSQRKDKDTRSDRGCLCFTRRYVLLQAWCTFRGCRGLASHMATAKT